MGSMFECKILEVCTLVMWMNKIESLASCSWYLLPVGVVLVTLQYSGRVIGACMVLCKLGCGAGLNFHFQHWRMIDVFVEELRNLLLSRPTLVPLQFQVMDQGCPCTRFRNQMGIRGTPLGEVVYSRLKSLACTEISHAT